MVLFEEEPWLAYLLATASLHIILVIFTVALWPSSLLMYKMLLLLNFSRQQKKKHALLYYGRKFLLLK